MGPFGCILSKNENYIDKKKDRFSKWISLFWVRWSFSAFTARCFEKSSFFTFNSRIFSSINRQIPAVNIKNIYFYPSAVFKRAALDLILIDKFNSHTCRLLTYQYDWMIVCFWHENQAISKGARSIYWVNYSKKSWDQFKQNNRFWFSSIDQLKKKFLLLLRICNKLLLTMLNNCFRGRFWPWLHYLHYCFVSAVFATPVHTKLFLVMKNSF